MKERTLLIYRSTALSHFLVDQMVPDVPHSCDADLSSRLEIMGLGEIGHVIAWRILPPHTIAGP